MQPQDFESATTAELHEQIDTLERKPYQAPSLVRIELKKTEAGATGTTDGGIFS